MPEDIEKAKSKLAELGDEFSFTSLYFREFLAELRRKVCEVTLWELLAKGRGLSARQNRICTQHDDVL